MSNTYRIEFRRAIRPGGDPLKFTLAITLPDAERLDPTKLVEFVYHAEQVPHEDFADALLAQFGGRQSLQAEHNDMTVTTERVETALQRTEREKRERGAV